MSMRNVFIVCCRGQPLPRPAVGVAACAAWEVFFSFSDV